jgi:hypothetical protein
MMVIKNSFADEDVLRWKRVYGGDPEFCLSRIRNGELNRGFEISDLSRAHQYVALIAIAQGDYALALGHLAAASVAWAYLLEREVAGDQIAPDVLNRASQGFILAAASGYEPAITRMAEAYAAAFRDAKSNRNPLVHFGEVLRWLCLREVEAASLSLTPVLRQDARATELLEAIIDHHEAVFKTAIAHRIEDWKRRIRSERLQKFPDAVCDDRMIGWVRLAERIWGRRPEIDLTAAKIPPEIFDAKPEFPELTP